MSEPTNAERAQRGVGVLRTFDVVTDATGSWFMCFACGRSGPTRSTSEVARADANAHICLPHERTLAAAATEHAQRPQSGGAVDRHA